MKRFLTSPFFWLFMLLACAEVVWSALLPYHQFPNAGVAFRNETQDRGWPEYISAQTMPGRELVVIISNSQGVGMELEDHQKNYTAVLRDMAIADDLPVQIENWSVDGIRAAPIQLLTLAAIKRGARLVLLNLSMRNLNKASLNRLGDHGSDVQVLAGRPGFWPYLPDTSFYANTTWHQIYKQSLHGSSALGRSRIAVHDRMSRWIDKKHHTTYFGRRLNRNSMMTVREMRDQFNQMVPADAVNAAPVVDAHAGKVRTLDYWRESFLRERWSTAEHLAMTLGQWATRTGIPLVWIWHPVSGSAFRHTLHEGSSDTVDGVCSIFNNYGQDCLDHRFSIPQDLFISDTLTSHFNQRGHQHMATLLYPVISGSGAIQRND